MITISEESAPLALFRVVAKHHGHDAWVHINPMLAEALRLAITSRMVFQEGDAAKIVHDYRGHHWLGPDHEEWYTLACTAENPSAIVSIEKWMERRPFILDGQRIWVGKFITWEGQTWRCTSIGDDFVRVKREAWATGDDGKMVRLPGTLKVIPRAGLEEKLAADKAREKAEREAERERLRPDPVDLLPLAEHFDRECRKSKHGRGWGTTHVDASLIEWAKAYGTDYRRAWKECERAWWLSEWLVWIGLCSRGTNARDADALRKRYSWPKVEAQIHRFVRECRGLPLRDSAPAAGSAP